MYNTSGTTQGVAKWWTGVDMSTPLLPEFIPEIDANPVSFSREEGYPSPLIDNI